MTREAPSALVDEEHNAARAELLSLIESRACSTGPENLAEDEENPVAAAITAAVELPDPLDGLVDRAADDPGAAFTPEVLERLAELKKEDRAAFETKRSQLRKVKCRVTELDKAIMQDG